MKKKNSIILMLIVLITMFVNINKAQAVTCNYTISGSIPVNIQAAIDKKKNKVTVSASSNCYIKLNGKGTSSQIQSCSGKTGKNTVYNYDSSCAKGDLKYSASKTLTNSKGCPKKLCMKKKSTKSKDLATCTYTRSIKTNTYPNTTAESFFLTVDKDLKKVALADRIDECKSNKYNNYAKDICEKINKGAVDYDEALNAKKCNYTYKLQELGSKGDCPKTLCLDKYLPKDKNSGEDTKKKRKKDETAKALNFANTQGCSLWGSLLLTFKMILTVVKWFMGVGLVILTMLDFAKAVIGSDPEGDLAKAKKKLTTRIIILIILFLIPSILDLLINNVLDVETCIKEIQ